MFILFSKKGILKNNEPIVPHTAILERIFAALKISDKTE
jgi:hypothetical protein